MLDAPKTISVPSFWHTTCYLASDVNRNIFGVGVFRFADFTCN